MHNQIIISITFIMLFLTTVSIQKVHCKSDNIIVRTSKGLIKGSLMKTFEGKDIYAFRGINYAEPPVVQLRFKDPVRVKPWKSVFDASKEAPACVQSNGINMTEDCLTLNIYTKDIRHKSKLPVIVFIHPGAYITGSSQSFVFGPLYLLDHDIVLVTINHRLCTFGFINTGDDYASGNYGFKDQVLALKFVRDNIAAFGGDPKSVTLAGQSSGSRSIILHLVSPLSKGLFHKAIAMSGTSILPIPPQKQQIDLAQKQARLLNCTIDTRKGMFSCMRNKTAKEFQETFGSFKIWNNFPTLIWYPSIEPNISRRTNFLNDNPEKLIKNRKINSVPLIIGYTKDEYGFAVVKPIEESMNGKNTYFEELNDNWFQLAPVCLGYEGKTKRSQYISERIRKQYFGNENVTLKNSDSLRKLYAQALGQYPIYRTARLIANYSKSPVYFYEFTYQSRYSRSYWSGTNKTAAGVAHGDDLQFIFNIPNNVYQHVRYPIFTRNDPEFLMVERMTNIWAHFAKTSKPLPRNRKLYGNVRWPKFTSKNEYYLNIGKEMQIEKSVNPKTNRFWDSLFP